MGYQLSALLFEFESRSILIRISQLNNLVEPIRFLLVLHDFVLFTQKIEQLMTKSIIHLLVERLAKRNHTKVIVTVRSEQCVLQ